MEAETIACSQVRRNVRRTLSHLVYSKSKRGVGCGQNDQGITSERASGDRLRRSLVKQ